MAQEFARAEYNDFYKAGYACPKLVKKLAKAGDWGANKNVARDVQKVFDQGVARG